MSEDPSPLRLRRDEFLIFDFDEICSGRKRVRLPQRVAMRSGREEGSGGRIGRRCTMQVVVKCGGRRRGARWRHSRVDRAGETWHAPGMDAAVIPSPRSIRIFCQAHAISRLRLFGSALRGDFDPLRSDVDLLVEYEAGRHPGLDHFQVAEELSELFGRKVDLNTPAMLGRHLEKVLPEARLLYGKA